VEKRRRGEGRAAGTLISAEVEARPRARLSPPDAPMRRPAALASPPEEGTGAVHYVRHAQQRSGTVPAGRCEGEREAAPHADGTAGDWSRGANDDAGDRGASHRAPSDVAVLTAHRRLQAGPHFRGSQPPASVGTKAHVHGSSEVRHAPAARHTRARTPPPLQAGHPFRGSQRPASVGMQAHVQSTEKSRHARPRPVAFARGDPSERHVSSSG
jgi:hypothetical protein